MTLRRLFFVLTTLLALPAAAQTAGESFEAFRQRIHADYGQFRQRVLDGYDTFLSQAWERYEAFSGYKRDFGPKPRRQPSAVPAAQPEPVAPAPPAVTPPAPPVPVPPSMLSVDFYGATLALPAAPFPQCQLGGRDDAARLWRQLKGAGVAGCAARIYDAGQRAGLSDWAIVRLADRYVAAALPSATADTRMAVLHFLVAHMGYDVRLASMSGTMRLLVAYAQKAYEQSRVNIDGTSYYLWPDTQRGPVYTCPLPRDEEHGRRVDLLFHGALRLGGESRAFSLSAEGLTASGRVEVAAMRLTDDYPIIDVPTCAASVLDDPLRRAVAAQLAQGVRGLGEQEAARRLLSFCQHCFQYATDDEQFGHEKPFYFEESLYYPANDCEDRAIFYAYLVRHILGLDVRLIHFPGHECTAVAFTSPTPEGSAFQLDGKPFYICDPTYIGADIGMCMPQYTAVQPEVEP